MDRIYLGLGSNLGNRKFNLRSALAALGNRGIQVLQVSPFFETQAVAPDGQPDYLNCACRVQSLLSAERLLRHCQEIEESLGRVRAARWAPRPIDIDVLYYGDWILRTGDLKIPHPRLHLRRFVLVPLAAIAAEFRDPLSRQSVRDLLRDCPDSSWIHPVL